MAEDTQNQLNESPLNEAFYAQDASIDKLDIVISTGEKVNLKKLLIEFSYFEDIFSFVVSGYIILRDGVGLVEKLQLTGKEFLKINFGKARGLSTNNESTFRLYSIPKRTPAGNQNSEFLKLYFCSEELLLSEQTKTLKSYKGWIISDIVYDILTEKLKINPSRISIEPTKGNYDFNVNTLKPFEAVSWVSCYAKPAFASNIGADMLMFETQNGFNFRSISTLMKQNPYSEYVYQPKNLSVSDFGNQLKTVLDYEFMKSFDTLEDINSGTFANRLISLDPLNRTVKVTNFDYANYLGLTGGGTSALSPTPNRLGKTQNQSYTGNLKLAIGNSNQKKKEYVQDGVGSLANDIYVETFIPQRTAQLSLATYTRIKIRIPGDSAITVGSTINFNLMSLSQSSETDKDFDKFYSGKYLVVAIRHIIQSQGAFQTILEIAREKPKNSYQNMNISSNYTEALSE